MLLTRSVRKYGCTLDEFVYGRGSKPRVTMCYRVLWFCYPNHKNGPSVCPCCAACGFCLPVSSELASLCGGRGKKGYDVVGFRLIIGREPELVGGGADKNRHKKRKRE